MSANPIVLVRGGGDLATGVAARLHRAAFRVLVAELETPLAVRRTVAAAQAVYTGEIDIEELHVVRVEDHDSVRQAWRAGNLPVVVDPQGRSNEEWEPPVVVDARMKKSAPEWGKEAAPLAIGLGPGFTAGVNCHALVETQRGHDLGRVIWSGPAAPDSGVPEQVAGFEADRVLRAPAAGHVRAVVQLGDLLQEGDTIAMVDGSEVVAPFKGILRGLVHERVAVEPGMKIGDLDPRGEPRNAFSISDKALAVGGGVLEAVLTRPEIRRQLS